MKYPMWHIRYCDARNKLGEAIANMEQACYEDGNNKVFGKFCENMRKLQGSVDWQMAKNFKRGRKEGWYK